MDHQKTTTNQLFSEREMLELLLRASHGKAWRCGYESRNNDNTIAYCNYKLDHIIPRVMDGDDDIINRVPLCQEHNGKMGGRSITLTDLRLEIAMAGEMKVRDRRHLIDLNEAREAAQKIRLERVQQMYGRPLIDND